MGSPDGERGGTPRGSVTVTTTTDEENCRWTERLNSQDGDGCRPSSPPNVQAACHPVGRFSRLSRLSEGFGGAGGRRHRARWCPEAGGRPRELLIPGSALRGSYRCLRSRGASAVQGLSHVSHPGTCHLPGLSSDTSFLQPCKRGDVFADVGAPRWRGEALGPRSRCPGSLYSIHGG